MSPPRPRSVGTATAALGDRRENPAQCEGTSDEAKIRAALKVRTGPYRTKPLKEPSGGRTPPVETIADARAAVSLIREVLAEEGRPIKGPPSFDDLRSVESILRSRGRALKLATRHGELIEKDWAIRAGFAFTRLQRDALLFFSCCLMTDMNAAHFSRHGDVVMKTEVGPCLVCGAEHAGSLHGEH